MPLLFRHVAEYFKNRSTRANSLPKSMIIPTIEFDGTVFRQTGAIETGESDHQVGDSRASSLATTSTTAADGTFPIQSSVIDPEESVDWAGNLVARLSAIGAANDSLDVRSDCCEV